MKFKGSSFVCFHSVTMATIPDIAGPFLHMQSYMEICKRWKTQRFPDGKDVIVESCPNVPSLAVPD